MNITYKNRPVVNVILYLLMCQFIFLLMMWLVTLVVMVVLFISWWNTFLA